MHSFPSFDLTGQVALVTAAARGLGRDIALALAHAGAHVALGLRDINQSGGLAKEVEALGVKALPLQMDMTKLDEVRAAVKTTAAHFGRLDILVNNAGIAPDNLAENVTEEDFDRTLNINLKGTFHCAQLVVPHMMRQKEGAIVNISSVTFFVGMKNLTLRDSIDLRNHGVRPEWVREIYALGFGPYAVRQLIEVRNHGAKTEFFRALKETGFAQADPKEIIEAVDHGLNASALREGKKFGANLRLRQIIRLKTAGVI